MKRSRIQVGSRSQELLLASLKVEFGDTDEDTLNLKLRAVLFQSSEFTARCEAAESTDLTDEQRHHNRAGLLSEIVHSWDMTADDADETPIVPSVDELAAFAPLELQLIFMAMSEALKNSPKASSKSSKPSTPRKAKPRSS